MNKKRRDRENKGKGVGRLFKLIIAGVFLGISVLLFINSARSIMTAYNRSLLLQQAHEEVAELRLENLELLEEKEEVLDESYIEQEARDRISYVKDGEKIIVLPETGEEVVLGEEFSDDLEGDAQNKDEGWVRWWKLLKNGV